MSDTNAIVLCLLLVGAALLGVSAINARQTRKRLINQKIAQLKRKITELEDIAEAIEALTGNTTAARIVNKEIIDTLVGMRQLEPASPSLELKIDSTQQRIEEMSSPGYSCNLDRLCETDASIAHAQYLLGEAAIIIRKRQARGQIEQPQMTNLIQELSWAHLMVSVISLTGQGHKAMLKGDAMQAHAFYKKAQSSAKESAIKDERRHDWIRELGEIMSGQKKTVSLTLMPESRYNPDEKSTSAAGSQNQTLASGNTSGNAPDSAPLS